MTRSSIKSAIVGGVLFSAAALTPGHTQPSSWVDLPDQTLRFGSVSLYNENDVYLGGTDEHYTNGVKLSFLTTDLDSFTADPVPRPVQQVARLLDQVLPSGRDYRLGLSLGHNIYTPSNIHTPLLQPNDRPYAAWLYVGSAFQIYSPPRRFLGGEGSFARLDVFEVTLGMVGPAALGRQLQNGAHRLFGIRRAQGWDHQLRNEPGLNLVYERRYRVSTETFRDQRGWGADLIPHIGFSLGNIFTYATTGAEIRAGYRLPDDFGTNLIRPTGDSAASRRPGFNFFVFAATDLRAVARDVTLDGNTWRDSPSVEKRTLVADFRAGAALGLRRWQLTYTQVLRTREFKGQNDASVFGSFTLSYHY